MSCRRARSVVTLGPLISPPIVSCLFMFDCGYCIYGGFCRTASHLLTLAGLPIGRSETQIILRAFAMILANTASALLVVSNRMRLVYSMKYLDGR